MYCIERKDDLTVPRYNNEIEEFIYRVCYSDMLNAASNYIVNHPYSLDLSKSKTKFPDVALLKDMILECTTNMNIDEDHLIFDAIVSCTVELEQHDYDNTRSSDSSVWLRLSCIATITDKLDNFEVVKIINYSRSGNNSKLSQQASRNIVPIIHKNDLDAVADEFLEKYYPDALIRPIRVPITNIAESIGLNIIQSSHITEDFNVFGEIFLSDGKEVIFDLFKTRREEIDVHRGTILIDVNTFWERNLGCVNNTIAHEIFHWYKHRIYAAVKQILRNERTIACRCPSRNIYPNENAKWTDEQIMEWQANAVAPRILMPKKTFQKKVNELYTSYRYDETSLQIPVLTCIADDLAKFYGVSRQSALIRMTETGYPEAFIVLNALEKKDSHSYISVDNLFYLYETDKNFQSLLDSGDFRYVDGYVVINNSKYIETTNS